jgi:hypothetical protein
MGELDRGYDGWAYSLTSTSLQTLLPLAPPGVRVAAWVKPFAAYKRNVRIAYTWEPVIFRPGRDSSADGAPVGRDHLSQVITLQRGLTGAKPPQFCRWVLDLLGYDDQQDTLDDLFPGTHVMDAVLRQGVLPVAGHARGAQRAGMPSPQEFDHRLDAQFARLRDSTLESRPDFADEFNRYLPP